MWLVGCPFRIAKKGYFTAFGVVFNCSTSSCRNVYPADDAAMGIILVWENKKVRIHIFGIFSILNGTIANCQKGKITNNK